jgi:hypothetical protein
VPRAGRRRDSTAILCDPAGVPRKLLLIALVDPTCHGPNLDGLGTALMIAAIVLLALATLAIYVLVRVWTALVRALRAARAADAHAGLAERAWWYALVASALHLGAVTLIVDDGPRGPPVTAGLAMLATVALLLLIWAAVLAWRRGLRWPLVLSGVLVAGALALAWRGVA